MPHIMTGIYDPKFISAHLRETHLPREKDGSINIWTPLWNKMPVGGMKKEVISTTSMEMD